MLFTFRAIGHTSSTCQDFRLFCASIQSDSIPAFIAGPWVSVTILCDQSCIKACDLETEAGFPGQRPFTHVPGYVWGRIMVFWKCSYRLGLVTGGGDYVQVTPPSWELLPTVLQRILSLPLTLAWSDHTPPACQPWFNESVWTWCSNGSNWLFLLKMRI